MLTSRSEIPSGRNETGRFFQVSRSKFCSGRLLSFSQMWLFEIIHSVNLNYRWISSLNYLHFRHITYFIPTQNYSHGSSSFHYATNWTPLLTFPLSSSTAIFSKPLSCAESFPIGYAFTAPSSPSSTGTAK